MIQLGTGGPQNVYINSKNSENRGWAIASGQQHKANKNRKTLKHARIQSDGGGNAHQNVNHLL